MEELSLDDPRYLGFIVDLVQESEKRKLGMNSQLSSKTCGALWILITNCGLKVTAQQLEQVCDNTKKNTFMKFVKVVLEHITTFAPIFRKHNISV